ncbi:MAG: DNA translocase FtsK [Armatimonadetes bacterium]|nr:DNA translocase FtsK [Armatimonadota bacterium]MCX7967564.1 DNA translocase FtsK [Armatimonadota bacterium]MDW8143215.1 DNA translocase FtsK [Armatimonadota bacterium]
MPERRTATRKNGRRETTSVLPDLWYEVIGLVLIALGGLLFVGLSGRAGGVVLQILTNSLTSLFGIGSYAFATLLAVIGVALIAQKHRLPVISFSLGSAALLWVLVTALHLGVPSGRELTPENIAGHGGWIGALTSLLLRKAFGDVGAVIVLTLATLVGFLVASRRTLTELLEATRKKLSKWWASWLKSWHEHQRKQAAKREKAKTATLEKSEVETEKGKGSEQPIPEPASTTPQPQSAPRTSTQTDESDFPFPMETIVSAGTVKRSRKRNLPFLPEHYEKIVKALEPLRPEDNPETATSIEDGIRLVEETLASFKIEAKVVNVKRGPVITRYEVQPAPGIRVKRIENLADDLALALAAIDVRVEAPVPGKSVIGIEVPNKRIALVRLRELLELEEFKAAPSKLTFALGKDIAGVPKLADLSKMPHLLIGGATNSGKSVCLNSLIISIMSRAHPDEVKFSLIDPKRVELTLFNGAPHLAHPVVVDAKGAARALKCAIREMERRYRLFADRGVRNIDSYNEAVKDEEDEEPLPHIIIVIDELADLMMQAGSEFEKLICRIAQLARATGIHLVVATQRPSVNVITGLIKANIPSRIAFAVASQTDSRVILDCNGAERLIGRGDMLFQPIDAPKPIRIQGAFVSEQEVHRAVEVLVNEYGEPEEYLFDVYSEEDEEALMLGVKLDKKDPLFDRAVEIVRRKGYASASLLQRELEIGYPRAGKLIDQLEKAGIIGPAEGNKPRKVLIPLVDAPPLPESESGFDA